ncbi:enoyl-CoA hydratase/isomerase family protein [Tsukamurella ocularis]|uniref:enoyl-CoA hydratase/isomerase family protein n=1 Tax=Tsukamurella ocularis TaxID=1970234 RepID=UPI0039EFF9D3
MTDNPRVTTRDGIVDMVLDMPARRNALTRDTARAMLSALDSTLSDPETRVLLIRAEGPSFCSGLDLDDLNGPSAFAEWMPLWTEIHCRLAESAVPIVIAAQGAMVNAGAGLAMSADVLLVSDDAFLQVGEIKQGLAAPVCIAWLALRHPQAVARQICLLGDRIPADKLLRLSIAAAVHPASELTDRAREVAGQLARYPASGASRTAAALSAAYPTDMRTLLAGIAQAGDMAAPTEFAPARVR